jgi:spore coat polysaccharide biosynthesis protein SpsF
MKTGAIIQARTSSTRLPRKVLKELPYGSGITVLHQVIRRLQNAKKIDDIIVATTTGREDREIVEVAKAENIKWFRGSKDDVLSRYYLAAEQNKLDIVVRITSDCPCIDHEIIDSMIGKHLSTKSDYTTNTLKRTFPHGLDAEVVNFNILELAHKKAKQDFEREHVTPYFYKTRPDLFRITLVKAPKRLAVPDIRVTLDTGEDYALLCAVFDYLYPKKNLFGAEDIVALFKKKPWLKCINNKIIQKKIYDSLQEEIQEAIRICDFQDLKRAKEYLAQRLHEGFHNN